MWRAQYHRWNQPDLTVKPSEQPTDVISPPPSSGRTNHPSVNTVKWTLISLDDFKIIGEALAQVGTMQNDGLKEVARQIKPWDLFLLKTEKFKLNIRADDVPWSIQKQYAYKTEFTILKKWIMSSEVIDTSFIDTLNIRFLCYESDKENVIPFQHAIEAFGCNIKF